jgi:hypothetical protein
MNDHPQFDGMDFEQNDESCTCIIFRKDRSHPTKATEYMSECKRPAAPWQSHPKRMLRHKAMIQCARLAFGFGGIYDQDEAERFIEPPMKDITPVPVAKKKIGERGLDAAIASIQAGDYLITSLMDDYDLTDDQLQKVNDLLGVVDAV